MFDNVYIDDLRVVPTKVGGLGAPNPRQDITLRAARHGAIDRTLYYEGRVIELQGLIVGTDDYDAWLQFDAIKGKLQLGASRTFKFRRTGFPNDEQLAVTVASPVDDDTGYDHPNVIRWGVSLHAPDPRIYSAVLRSGSFDPAASTSGGGVDMPLTFPLEFSTTSLTHLELVNSGNTPTPPVLTINGPVVNPILDNDSTGESFSIVYSMGQSDVIEVDMSERTLKLNGALRYDLLSTDSVRWWELQPGTNRLRLRGAGMASGESLLTCQYRDARI